MSIYSQTANLLEVQKHFRLRDGQIDKAGHNLAFRRHLFIQPGITAPLITVGEGHKRELDFGQYGTKTSAGEHVVSLCGLDIPKWHSMMEPPRRCLIPATSFALGNDPTWFCFENDMPFSLFSIAGIIFRKAGELRFLTVSVPANRAVSYYSRTMPMILNPDEYACWLHAPWDFASEFLHPYKGNDLQVVNANALAKVG